MYLSPSEIRYSQDSIACTFSYGSHCGRPIGETLDDLLFGRCRDEDIPMMTVTFRNGHWYTGDNRRLWVFRTAEELGIIDYTIEVKKGWVNPNKFTTDNQGVDIEIRGNPGGRAWRKERRLKKRITRDPSPPKTVKPPVPVYNLPPIKIELKREDIPVFPHNVVPVDNRHSESNNFNNYIKDTTKNYNAPPRGLPSIGNSDGLSYSMTGSPTEGHDNPTFVKGKDIDTERVFGIDEEVPNSDVKSSYTADADVNNLIVTVNSSPGVYLQSHNDDTRDPPTSVDTIEERSNVTTNTSTTALDIEPGEIVSYRRSTWLTSHKSLIIGIVVASIVILTIILPVVLAFTIGS
ncbi:uncharacterized protein LOC110444706 [Mizuhopecten yessoensis]|uniref:uncharacterized protein LOC110444706 n=1 Tax=Mizuhopecten yessoensis TaxID=6573 RepID=UPI000B457690|nr:uncharacterized protein LOC110444706 [Mizuhopecten yessoensis]